MCLFSRLGKHESRSEQKSMKNQRVVRMLNETLCSIKTKARTVPGGGKEDTCDHALSGELKRITEGKKIHIKK